VIEFGRASLDRDLQKSYELNLEHFRITELATNVRIAGICHFVLARLRGAARCAPSRLMQSAAGDATIGAAFAVWHALGGACFCIMDLGFQVRASGCQGPCRRCVCSFCTLAAKTGKSLNGDSVPLRNPTTDMCKRSAAIVAAVLHAIRTTKGQGPGSNGSGGARQKRARHRASAFQPRACGSFPTVSGEISAPATACSSSSR
jgi:hypothetical protein